MCLPIIELATPLDGSSLPCLPIALCMFLHILYTAKNAASCNKSVDNKPISGCVRIIIKNTFVKRKVPKNKLKQINKLTNLLQFVNKLQQVSVKLTTCSKLHPDIGLLSTDLLQLARFWLCIPCMGLFRSATLPQV